METNTKLNTLLHRYRSQHGAEEVVVKAPGRANIIGEHVDYCDGLVLPFAIEQSMYFVGSKQAGSTLWMQALDLEEVYQTEISSPHQAFGWSNYVVQMLQILREGKYPISGFTISFASAIPMGGGVSSSSALCCGFLYFLNELFDMGLSSRQMIDIASAAEHGIGLKGGKMDQTAILFGQSGKAVLLDCESGAVEQVDLKLGESRFVLFDTCVKHNLVDSEYNERRSEVYDGLDLVNSLTNVDARFRTLKLTDIEVLQDRHPLHYKRLRHVVSEISRVAAAMEAISTADMYALGRLLNASHVSLSQDFEVSCAELDFLAEALQAQPNVQGCRMMGGGFGGNVIALLSGEQAAEQLEDMQQAYADRFGSQFRVLNVEPSRGLMRLS